MIKDFDEIASIGIVRDIPEYELNPNAWSDGQNIRIAKNKIEKIKGHAQVYLSSTASNSIVCAPFFAMPVSTGANYYWLYANSATIGMTDGNTHAAVSTATYSANTNLAWNGSVIGGIAVLTNGVNSPVQWGDSSAGPSSTKMVKPLEGWSTTDSVTCRFLRSYKNYLVAGDITEGGIRKPRLIWWSDAADLGNVPQSWDYTSTTVDAGRAELAETTDYLVDCLPLHDINIIYKENSTWGMQYIGGEFVFRFYKIFPDLGMLSKNCSAIYGGRNHAVLAANDIYTHDGQTFRSLFTSRMKDWVYNTIDSSAFIRSFVVPNYFRNEIWFCFPQTGETYPNLALIWNYQENTTTIRELPNASFMTFGIVDPNVSVSWGSDSGTWLSDTSYWDQQSYNPTLLSLLMTAGGNLYHVDSGETFAGTNMTSYIERRALPLSEDGRLYNDVSVLKMVRAIYPRITGSVGTVVQVYIGTQSVYEGTIAWSGPYNYTIGTTTKIYCRAVGKIISVKFQTTGTDSWALTGYRIDFHAMGAI